MADFYTRQAYFPAGSNLSVALDLGEGAQAIAILVPSGWTTANMTFQACDTVDGTFLNVYTSAGLELNYAASASRAVVDMPELAPLRYIKVRSGTSASPVTQVGTVSLTILVKE